MPGYPFILFFCFFVACLQNYAEGFKKTSFMSPVALAAHISVGDIIEKKITISIDNVTRDLPFSHTAIVVDPVALKIVQYRYKDENDMTAEELQKWKEVNRNEKILDYVIEQVMRDFRNAKSMDDLRRVKFNCGGDLKASFADIWHIYDPRNRKVYMDDLIGESGEGLWRVNNELDLKWDPLPGEIIAGRAINRVGEQKFDLIAHNCENLNNWARYGKNYTEQGERVAQAVDLAVQGFQDLCQRVNNELNFCYGCLYLISEREFKQKLIEKLMKYKPDVIKIIKNMMTTLKMEQIIKIEWILQ